MPITRNSVACCGRWTSTTAGRCCVTRCGSPPSPSRGRSSRAAGNGRSSTSRRRRGGSRRAGEDAPTTPCPLSRARRLNEVRESHGRERPMFSSLRNWQRPGSENAMNLALRRTGYTTEEHTAYGFRTTASALLNEAVLRSRPHQGAVGASRLQSRRERRLRQRRNISESRRMGFWEDSAFLRSSVDMGNDRYCSHQASLRSTEPGVG